MSRLLTIGMPTYDDYDGVFFTIQAIRMYHKEILNDIEFVIIDNNPKGDHSSAIKAFTEQIGTKGHGLLNQGDNKVAKARVPIQHILLTEQKGPAYAKNHVFIHAKTPYVLCMDGHILLEPGSLKKLIQYYKDNPNTNDLLQGPMLYDDLVSPATHFDPVWRGHMHGIWATDDRGVKPNQAPFEIPMQGMGVFSCRNKIWPGFNDKFRGFGGEEGYIHDKFRNLGYKTLCLPFLRWNHRFGRPDGVKYRLDLTDRIWNYFVGFLENGKDVQPIIDHFNNEIDPSIVKGIYENVKHFIETGEDKTKPKSKKSVKSASDRVKVIEEVDNATCDTIKRTEGTLCYGETVPGRRIGTVYVDGKAHPVYGDGFQKECVKLYPHTHIYERISPEKAN